MEKFENQPIQGIAAYMPTEPEKPSRIAAILTVLLILTPIVGYAFSKPAQIKFVEYGRGKTVYELDDEIVMPLYKKTVLPPRIAAGV